MLVPLLSSCVESLIFEDDTMRSPGAMMSTHDPWFEKLVLKKSPVLDDATEMTFGDSAGAKLQASAASLPAAATTVMPWSTALSANCTMELPDDAGAPSDRLMTLGRRGDLPVICDADETAACEVRPTWHTIV